MKQLIIIAGPAASGKSFLLNKIRNGHCPALCEQLGIDDPGSWHFTTVFQLMELQTIQQSKIITHCDLYNEKIIDYAAALLSASDNTITVTLCPSPATLSARNRKRIKKRTAEFFQNPTQPIRKIKWIRTLWHRQTINTNKTRLRRIYNSWFSLLERHATTDYRIDSNEMDNPVAIPLKNHPSDSFQFVLERN